MKKAFIRISCLLLGVNVFTACYGPARPPEGGWEDEIQEAMNEAEEKSAQAEDPAQELASEEEEI